jgi:hypothetical protein
MRPRFNPLNPIQLPETIKQRPTAELLPATANARTHSEEQVDQLVKSIRRFGWTNPVLVGADGVIIAGHARVLAARRLKLDRVPVIVLGHLSEAERRALVIADNQLALNAGWNDEILRAELQDIEASGFDMDLLGFSDDELCDLMAEPPVEEDPANTETTDETPEAPSDPVTRQGDIWVISPHRLICGDCRDLAVVKAVLGGQTVNVAIMEIRVSESRRNHYTKLRTCRPTAAVIRPSSECCARA